MMFKKGDKVRTDDGHMGEILFIDNDGVEAQVALERVTMRLRTETLRVFDEKDDCKADWSKQPATRAKRAQRRAKK
jgi:preprotein translocase subunit YajC